MDLKVIPVIKVAISVALMVFISTFMTSLTYIFSASYTIAIVIFNLAFLIAALAIYCFIKHQTTVNPAHPEQASKVVNSGIYAYTRNPMYLAMALALLALAIYLENIAVFSIIPLFIGYITKFQIIPEEKALTTLFTDDYLDYKNNVRRWF